MGHFYNFGADRYHDVDVIFPKDSDKFDADERREILQRIDEVIAIVDFDEDVMLTDRQTYERWKQNGELEASDAQTWEEYVRHILENCWPFAVFLRR